MNLRIRQLLLIALGLLVFSQLSCSDPPPEGFTVLLDAAPKGLDPRFATSDASAKLVGIHHAGLVSVDTESGEPELELAESIERKSSTHYEIVLKKGLTFHDGEPLTAEDVEYTLMELDSDTVNSPYAGTTRRIKAFEVVDDRRIRIELEEPYAPFLSDLAIGIVPKHLCGGEPQCPEQSVGAGPFKFARQEGDKLFVFEKFDDYVGGAPQLDRVIFKAVEDDNTRLLALLGNTAHLVQNAVQPLMLPVVEKADKLEMKSAPSFKYTYLGLNLEHEILDDVKVRRALAHGIDRDAIVEYKFQGYARLSSGMLAPNHWAYEPDVRRYDYDPERAKELLDEAGFPDPDGDGPQMRFELEFKVSASKFRKSVADLIAHQLARVGVGIKVRAYEWGTFFADIKSRNFAMTTLQWPSVLDPGLYRWIFHSENIPSAENRSAGANRGAYRNSRVDALLEKGQRESDPEARKAIYGEIQKILAKELPYISLWHEDNIAIMQQNVEGYYMTPNARFEGLKDTRLLEESKR
ncbi:MAG: ABC transporter substrate-binding protein [Myxococcota bacterium]